MSDHILAADPVGLLAVVHKLLTAIKMTIPGAWAFSQQRLGYKFVCRLEACGPGLRTV